MTDKQKLFIEAYLGEAHFNATQAARIAGYKDPEKESWRIRQAPDVAAAISERVSQYAMSAEQVLAELSDIALNSSVMALLDAAVYGKPEVVLSHKSGELKPESKYIRRFSSTDQGVSVEVYDRFAALVQLGKFHKLWVEKTETEISGPGGRPIGIEVVGIDYRAAIANLAPGPVDDSDTPGQN